MTEIFAFSACNAAISAFRSAGSSGWLFAGNDAGGETLACAMTLIESAKLSGLVPQAYLADVLARINDHINPWLYELLPWNWKPRPAGDNKIAA